MVIYSEDEIGDENTLHGQYALICNVKSKRYTQLPLCLRRVKNRMHLITVCVF